MNWKKGWVVLFFVAVLWVPALMGQTAGTGALTGTVKDPSGAVIPNATVTATNVDTGQVRTTMTGGDGNYKFSLLPPGNYRVRMEASGFKPVEVPSATVNVTETAVLDRSLDVGAQTQTITVEGAVETIQTATSSLGTVVDTRSITALPLSTRNYTNLLAMTAGASANVTNSTTLGKASTGIAVNGADIGQNTYLQDGVAVDTWMSTNTTQEGTAYGAFPTPNPDSLQEFKIQTSNYDAGYGRNPGANVNVVTKSGTNQFHGSGFEFFRNTSLNANDWFRNATGGSRLTLNQNQYGGTFGGPIKKDKLFFFVAYQETAEKNGIAGFGYSVVNLSPIPNVTDRGNCPVGSLSVSQCNAAAQNFASLLGAAVCPGNNSGNSKDKVKQGTLQVACDGSNINPVAINVMALKLANGQFVMPGAYTVPGGSSAPNAGAAAQYPAASFSAPATFHDHQGMGNFDYVLSGKHTLSGRYFFEQDPTNGNFASNGTRITATSILPGFPVFSQKTNQAALLRLTSILSNNVVNEVRVSYQRLIAVANNLNTYKNSQVGIADLTPGVDNLSAFSLGGMYAFGSNTAFGILSRSNQFEGADQLSWTHGKHSMRTGFEVQRIQANQSTPGSTYMTVTFQTFPDFLIGRSACLAGATGPVGVAPGPFINNANGLPVPCNGGTVGSNIRGVGGTTLANSQFDFPFRFNIFDAFLQDDVKLTSRLTVNAGVRWEWDGFPIVSNGVTSNIWPSLMKLAPIPGSTPQTGSLAGIVVSNNFQGPVPAGVYKSPTPYATRNSPPLHNFAPRVGFAWQPTSSNRFVVRGGGGMFYELVNGVQAALFPMRVSPGVANVQSSVLSSLQQPGVPPFAIPGPPGSYGFTPRWADFTTGQTSNLQQNLLPEDLKTPVTYEWNLNLQDEFLHNWVLELGYVGSHGIHQEQGGAVHNAISWNPGLLASPTNPVNGLTTNTAANVNLRTPYPGIATTDNMFATNGAYKFNALLATVRRQFSNGLQLQAAYTWDAGFTTQTYGINTAPYVILQYERSPIYHPQRVVFNYTWTLPVHLAGFKGKLLNDWTWSGVTTIQNGVPFSIYDSSSGSVFFSGGAPGNTNGPAQLCPGANLLTSGNIESRLGPPYSANGFVNTAAFAGGKGAPSSCSLPILGDDGKATGFGNIGMGTFLSPGQSNWDMSVTKLIKIRERQSLQFRAEFFNAFNHPQFSFDPVNDEALNAQDVAASNFGAITTTSVNPRLIQFAVKYTF